MLIQSDANSKQKANIIYSTVLFSDFSQLSLSLRIGAKLSSEFCRKFLLQFAEYLHLHFWELFLSASDTTDDCLPVLWPWRAGKWWHPNRNASVQLQITFATVPPGAETPQTGTLTPSPQTAEIHSTFFLLLLFFVSNPKCVLIKLTCYRYLSFILTKRIFFAPKLFS